MVIIKTMDSHRNKTEIDETTMFLLWGRTLMVARLSILSSRPDCVLACVSDADRLPSGKKGEIARIP
jgi:hypothetical protein